MKFMNKNINTDKNDYQSTESQVSQPKKQVPFSKKWSAFWKKLLWEGLGDRFLRLGSIAVTFLLVAVVILTGVKFFLRNQNSTPQQTQSQFQKDQYQHEAVLPYYNPSFPNSELQQLNQGVFRFSQDHTDLPAKARDLIVTYTVQEGDTITSIAEKFALNPSTILWGNPYTLQDDPHKLKVGMEINIMPVDGVLYEWHEGDGLNGVAEVLHVKPEDIINYPANNLSMDTIGNFSNPNIKPGTWLIVPGGSREFISLTGGAVTRENPAVASIYGPGACQSVMDGPIGSGTFVWPTTETWLSGYDYDTETNHRAIDIAGSLGNPVYAADDGVVVYAGWNNNGYGNVVMIDHGNGFQTLYAHLESYNVACGYYALKGQVIGGLGTTGNSSGPHLHFEIRYNGVPQNPHNFF